jgi:hypothetical protein
LELAKLPRDEVLRYEAGARAVVVNDCLHFSITTMTTAGYGNISPQAWYTKLAADCQLLAGVFLFGVGLAHTFGKVSGKDDAD